MKNALFRLSFLFFTLYIFFNPNGFIPFIDYAFEIYIRPFHTLVPWIGRHWLHLSYPITTFTNGSGDTTYDLVIYVLIILLSVIGCVVWSLLDRRRSGYPVLQYWLIVLVRYYFAFTMINYGFAKFFKLQFPFPSLYGLSETYGSSSPMRLAWNFLGYSRGYNYFMGFAEMASGLLLLSTTLVIMAAYLLYQQREHHFNYFFRNRMADPESGRRPVFRKRWVGISLIVLKFVLIVFVLGGELYGISRYLKEYTAEPPLYGIYDVQTFVRNKDTLAPLTTDTVRWRKLIVSGKDYAWVRLMAYSLAGKDGMRLWGSWMSDSEPGFSSDQ